MTFCWRPTRKRSRRTRIPWFAVALFSASFLCATRSSAQDPQDDQDVAVAARHQKARKSTEAKPQSHVYTNGDLQKSQILTEQDRARVEARKKSAPPPQTVEPALSLDANSDAPAESLGEVARRYRREKAADGAEQAIRPKPPAPFPMDLSQPTFATPAPVGPPPSAPRAPLAPIAPPAAASKPRFGRAPLKRDPFSRPAISPSLRTPNPGPAPRIIAPAKPSPVAPPSEPSTPKRALIVQRAPSAANSAPTKVLVHQGDSLWKIAFTHYGDGAQWQCIATANPGLRDPGQIYPGQTLLLPSSCGLLQVSKSSE